MADEQQSEQENEKNQIFIKCKWNRMISPFYHSKIGDANKLLTDGRDCYYIKSRVNRLSVLSAIKSTQERLKLYKSCPTADQLFVVVSLPTKIKRKRSIDLEPFRPVSTYVIINSYRCFSGHLMMMLNTVLLLQGGSFGVLHGNNKIYYINSRNYPKNIIGGQSAARSGNYV